MGDPAFSSTINKPPGLSLGDWTDSFYIRWLSFSRRNVRFSLKELLITLEIEFADDVKRSGGLLIHDLLNMEAACRVPTGIGKKKPAFCCPPRYFSV